MKTIEDVKAEIETLNETLNDKRTLVEEYQNNLDKYEIDQDDYEEQYVEMLDSDGEVDVAGLTFYPSDIIKECDPTAYRCGMNDYCASLDVSDDAGYKEIEEEKENTEDEIYDLEEELETLEEELEELEEEQEEDE